MTSPNHGEERQKSTNDDGNTSDDSLLLADDQLDRTPLLAATSREVTMRDEDLTQQSLTQSTHCHVPDDKFDYAARNRLILVLLVCIVFMVIEIVGPFHFDRVPKSIPFLQEESYRIPRPSSRTPLTWPLT